MSFQGALLFALVLWSVLLTLGMAGCVRALKFMKSQLDAIQYGRRTTPVDVGEVIALPTELSGLRGTHKVLLFLTGDCGSCAVAAEEARRVVSMHAQVAFLELWKSEASVAAPTVVPADYVVATHQSEIHAQLGIRLTPFGVAVDPDGYVVARGGLGTPEKLHHLVQHTITHSKRHLAEVEP